jgi:hypothetical protein
MVKRQKSMHELRHGGSPGILSRLWAGIETRIPFGYQTKTGFHYGTIGRSPGWFFDRLAFHFLAGRKPVQKIR